MGTITEGFIGGLAATAQSDCSPSGKSERVSLGIVNRELALDTNRAVGVDRDFRWHKDR